jgi:hypothetical protein
MSARRVLAVAAFLAVAGGGGELLRGLSNPHGRRGLVEVCGEIPRGLVCPNGHPGLIDACPCGPHGPSMANLAWWGIGDRDVEATDPLAPTECTRIGDQTIYQRDAIPVANINVFRPIITPNVLNGRQGIRFSETTHGQRFMEAAINISPVNIGPTDPRTVYTVVVPTSAVGGSLFGTGGDGASGRPYFNFVLFLFGGVQYGYTNWLAMTDALPAVVNYTGVPLIVAQYTDGATAKMKINGVELPLTPDTIDTTCTTVGGFNVLGMFGNGGLFKLGFDGFFCEQMLYHGGAGQAANLYGTSADVRNHAYLRAAWGFA